MSASVAVVSSAALKRVEVAPSERSTPVTHHRHIPTNEQVKPFHTGRNQVDCSYCTEPICEGEPVAFDEAGLLIHLEHEDPSWAPATLLFDRPVLHEPSVPEPGVACLGCFIVPAVNGACGCWT